MEKTAAGGRRRPPPLHFLAAVSAATWLLILYCHFSVFDDSPVSSPHPSALALVSGDDDGEREIKKLVSVRALATAKDGRRDACEGRYVYVHDLPPRFNADMLRTCGEWYRWIDMCVYLSNGGLGEQLDNTDGMFSDEGWYATDHFILDIIFHNRMKQYECLTDDSSLASSIFVPFYAGFDIVQHLWGHNVSTRDAAVLELVDWLTRQPEWSRMGGRDHFMLSGRTAWDYRRQTDSDDDWGSKLLLLPAVKNMTTLLVEKSPWTDYDFAVPWPTYFHPAKDADVLRWQQRMRGMRRKWLFSFAGSARPEDPASIRGHLIRQCGASRFCNLLHCRTGDKRRMCLKPRNIMRMFQGSRFCLQPQGDTFTRRSAFDAILVGCIPVFFHPNSAYLQYVWHLPKEHDKYSVFISEESIRSHNVSIEETLRRISPEVAEEMTETVIGLIPRLVYADPRSKLETLKDAVDLTVEAVIERVRKLRVAGMSDGRRGNLMQKARSAFG